MINIKKAFKEKPIETIIIFSSISLLAIILNLQINVISYLTVFYFNIFKALAALLFAIIIMISTKSFFSKKSIFSNKKIKNILTNISVFFLTTLLLAALTEALFAEYAPSPIVTEFSETLHHKNKQNLQGRIIQMEIDMNFKINSLGFRGDEIQEKTKKRVLMLGDSFTFGHGVSDEETFSKITEKELDNKVEIINAGVVSYSPMLEYLQLKGDFNKIQPDIVVLNFDLGDLHDDFLYEKEAEFTKNGEVSFKKPKKGFNLTGFYKSSKFLDFIRAGLLDPLVLKIKPLKNFIEIETPAIGHIEFGDRYGITRGIPGFENEWDRTFNYIKKMNDFCKQKGVKFILHVYPYGHQVNEMEWDYGRYYWAIKRDVVYNDQSAFQKLENFAKENNITFLNSFNAIKNASKEKILYYSLDGHFNKEGHLTVGVFLSEELRKILSANTK